MLSRSTSSRRGQASRSVASSPQSGSVPGAVTAPRARRASVATDGPIFSSQENTSSNRMDKHRAPRRSVVPNISFDIENDNEESINRRILPDPEYCGSRVLPDLNRSPRNSLVPDDYSRSFRGSSISDSSRSPRNSLVPDGSRSPRHSLIPDESPSLRNSYVPDGSYNRSPRNSLIPTSGVTRIIPPRDNDSIRASRHSLLLEASRSPRGSISNIDFDRSPRGSVCPEITRSTRENMTMSMDQDRSTRSLNSAEIIPTRSRRSSITPVIDLDRNPRNSISSEHHNSSSRSPIMSECNKSPRGSIGPDMNRSPRGSIGPEGGRSPRGSIGLHESGNKSPRGSIGIPEHERNHRGSINEDGTTSRSSRGSIGPEIDRSPKGNLGGFDRRSHRGNSLTFQESRRASADQEPLGGSPFRDRETNSGSIRSGATHGVQTNPGYGTNAWADSRRASSSISQLSGDESRRLCIRNVNTTEKGITADSGGVRVATYGSLMFQLKDAHREASGTCDFVFRAIGVVSKTMLVTICLACLSTMPIIMLIMGLQFIKDCPKEPQIPVYMIVGGSLGGVRMFWALYAQIRSRRLEVISVPNASPHISPMRLVSIALTCFLTVWFALGNYWILKIRWPDFEAKMFDPDHWCAKTLYIFAVVHLGIIYAVLGVGIITALSFAICRALACPWFERSFRLRECINESFEPTPPRSLTRVSSNKKILHQVNEDDGVQHENGIEVNGTDGDKKIKEVVQEIKFSSRVQFRAPDIIEL